MEIQDIIDNGDTFTIKEQELVDYLEDKIFDLNAKNKVLKEYLSKLIGEYNET